VILHIDPHDLGILIEGVFYGMVILATLERIVFPLSFRLSRYLDRFRLRS
jgi:hypothetical protein